MSLNSKRSYIKQCQQTLHGIKSKKATRQLKHKQKKKVTQPM